MSGARPSRRVEGPRAPRVEPRPRPSPSLAETYQGRSLLVTGTTGFLAKAFVAKVLRDLEGVERLVLLIRSTQRGGRRVPAAERLRREVVGSSAFRRLRSELGGRFDDVVASRLVALEGDLGRADLGLDAAGLAALEGLDAVVHSAATVSFDEELPIALAVNTLGPSHLMETCRRLGDIPFLHVSTAYSCGRLTGTIAERPPSLTRAVVDDLERRAEGTLDLDREIAELREACRRAEEESRSPELAARLARDLGGGGDEAIAAARARWLHDRLVELGMSKARERGWNDTYTYTKSLGERLLVRDRGAVPACIVRPAIIESSLAEPEPGWIDGLRMADPLFAAYGKGVLREFPIDPDSLIDFIPADHVVNTMIAALGRLLQGDAPAETPVYHVATSTANPLKFRHLFEMTRTYFLAHPLTGRNGKPVKPAWWALVDEERFGRTMKRQLAAIDALAWAARALPGRTGRSARQRAGRMRAHVERLLYYVKIYKPYCAFPARFETTRTEELFASLPAADQERFPFDPKQLEWEEYLQDVHLPGLVRNVLREAAPGPIAHSSASFEAEPQAAAGRTLFDLLAESASRHGDRTAAQVKRGGSWTKLTYRQLHERALAAASALRAAGVAPGDRVVLQSENAPEWPLAYFAVMAAGAVVVPLDAQTPAARVREVARIVSASAALLSPRCAEALGDVPGLRVLLTTKLPTARPPNAADVPVPTSAEAPASILFTSGTTLDPKGVVLPHRAFLANVESVRDVLQPSPDDRVVSVLPLHHAFEFTAGMLAPLSAGAMVTYLEALSSESIVSALQETRATYLLGVPRLYELMLAAIEREVAQKGSGGELAFGALRGTSRAFQAVGLNAGRALLAPVHAKFGGHVRAFISGGAALPPRVHDEFQALGFSVLEGYGLTETAPVLTVNPPGRSKAGSVGRPVPGVELRIHHPDADGIGEIVVRGANVMAGYYEDPHATARVMRDGWFHTGDLGRLDEDGYLHVTGRLKDLIVTGAGKNVHPDEVEAALAGLPGVKEACVVGARSKDQAGEEVRLVVVLERPSPEAEEAVRREVDARAKDMPSHQRVQRVHFWQEELPKTALLKVRRGVVRERLEGEGAERRPAARKGPRDPATREILDLLARLTRVPADELSPEQSLSFDLGVDSLMKAELVAAVEARSGRPVSDEAAQALATVQDLAELARAHAAAPAQRARRAAAEAKTPAAAGGGAAGPALLARATAPLVRALGPVFYRQYLRLTVAGRHELPRSGPYILAANHQSHLDAGAVLVALGEDARRLHVVAARDYFFDTPVKGAFFGELLNAIPFDRQGDFEPGLEACRRALRAGEPLLIFPEGTRSLDGRLQPFKAGLGVLAVELGVPVVPARIDGTHDALPKGSRFPRRRPVRVTFGAALPPPPPRADALPYERYRDVVEAVRHRIASLAEDGAGAA